MAHWFNLSGGIALSIMNHDTSIATSPSTTFALNPTISVSGTIKRTSYITGGSGGSRVGGTSPFSHEFIIPPATQDVITFTNLDGNAVIYNFIADFYEV